MSSWICLPTKIAFLCVNILISEGGGPFCMQCEYSQLFSCQIWNPDLPSSLDAICSVAPPPSVSRPINQQSFLQKSATPRNSPPRSSTCWGVQMCLILLGGTSGNYIFAAFLFWNTFCSHWPSAVVFDGLSPFRSSGNSLALILKFKCFWYSARISTTCLFWFQLIGSSSLESSPKVSIIQNAIFLLQGPG